MLTMKGQRRVSRVITPPREMLETETPGHADGGGMTIYEQGPKKSRRMSRVSVTSSEGDGKEVSRSRRTSRVSLGSLDETSDVEGSRRSRGPSIASISQPLHEEDLGKLSRSRRASRSQPPPPPRDQPTPVLNAGKKRSDSLGRISDQQLVHYEFSYSKAVCDYVRSHSPERKKTRKTLPNPHTNNNAPGKNVPIFLDDVILHHVHKIDLFNIPEEATFIWESTGAPTWSFTPKLYCPSLGLGEEKERKGRNSIQRDKIGGVDHHTRRPSKDVRTKDAKPHNDESNTEKNDNQDNEVVKPRGQKHSRVLPPIKTNITQFEAEPNPGNQATDSGVTIIPGVEEEIARKFDTDSCSQSHDGDLATTQNDEEEKARRKKSKKYVVFSLPALQCAPVPDTRVSLSDNVKHKPGDTDKTSGQSSPRRQSKVPKLPKI